MKKPMSNLMFKLMSFVYKLRDFFLNHKEILQDVGIKSGDNVLDFGCGPGGYITDASELVGKMGKIYALDIQPQAIKKVQEIILKNNHSNVSTLLSNGKIELNDESIDILLLFEVLHSLEELDEHFDELYRVLKINGILSILDPFLDHGELVSKLIKNGSFRLFKKNKHRSDFQKI